MHLDGILAAKTLLITAIFLYVWSIVIVVTKCFTNCKLICHKQLIPDAVWRRDKMILFGVPGHFSCWPCGVGEIVELAPMQAKTAISFALGLCMILCHFCLVYAVFVITQHFAHSTYIIFASKLYLPLYNRAIQVRNHQQKICMLS